jgi:uncharacterized membrane protein
MQESHVRGPGSEVAPSQRATAIDRMRGLVMVLMAIDHADMVFDRSHQFHDSARIYAGQAFPALEYFTRWMTHLCAPTFVFLAGVAIAFSVAGQRARSVPDTVIDRHLIKRGLLIALLDPLFMSLAFGGLIRSHVITLQVLYAIGVSMALMPLVRRVPRGLLALAAVGLLAITELVFATELPAFRANVEPPVWMGALVTGGEYPAGPLRVVVLYSLLPWLAVMMLGWVVGGWALRAGRDRMARGLLAGGLAALAGFVALRWANGWGNAELLRTDGSLLQWLHVSKYPPSVTFALLELGIMAVILSGFVWLEHSGRLRALARGPLLVFGRTALFFYLLHVPIIQALAWGTWLVTGADPERHPPAFGVGASYIVAAVVLIILYPLCIAYDHYKRAHPHGWTRYL